MQHIIYFHLITVTHENELNMCIHLTDDPTVFALEGGARAGDGPARASVIGCWPAAVTV